VFGIVVGAPFTDKSQITEIRSAQDCYFTDEETAACVDEAHRLGKRLCAHARARDSVTMCE
jgi:imidazolonepropionase-like amidohydrolase